MEKSIGIIYDVKQNVKFSFWKYYFEMTGMWVNAEQYDGSQDPVRYENERILFITSKRSEWLVSGNPKRNHFYIVKENSQLVEEQRPDVYNMNFKTKGEGRVVLSWLFQLDPEIKELLWLYNYYEKNGIWKYLWLFQEFSYEEGDLDYWAEKTITVCDRFLKSIIRRWEYTRYSYVSYVYLYVSYIRLAMKGRLERLYLKEVEALLLQGQSMTERINTMPAFHMLLGRICGLNTGLRHWSISYYLKTLSGCRKMERACTYELMYKIGRTYEKKYGDWDTAVIYYHRSLNGNRKFYRAIYKLGVKAEREEKWDDAVDCYKMIEQNLMVQWQYKQVSIKTLEYLCKVWNRLSDIHKTFLPSPLISQYYSRKLNRIDIYLEWYMRGLKRGEPDFLKNGKNELKKFGKFFNCVGFSGEEQIQLLYNVKQKVHEVSCR